MATRELQHEVVEEKYCERDLAAGRSGSMNVFEEFAAAVEESTKMDFVKTDGFEMAARLALAGRDAITTCVDRWVSEAAIETAARDYVPKFDQAVKSLEQIEKSAPSRLKRDEVEVLLAETEKYLTICSIIAEGGRFEPRYVRVIEQLSGNSKRAALIAAL